MKVVVTGGGGFLGSYIVKKLAEEGHAVTSFSRGDYPALRALGVRTLSGDLADPRAVDAACAGADVVYHVASKVGAWGAYAPYYEANVRGTENVLDACVRHGVERLVYTSSPSVVFGTDDIRDGDESLPYPATFSSAYQRTKAEAEQRVLAANGKGGLVTTALRVHAVWGVGDNHLFPRIVALAEQGALRVVGDGRNRMSLTHVHNAARAHLQAAAADPARVGGKAYFINDPEPVVFWAWLNGVLERLGLSPARKKTPYLVAYALGQSLEAAHTAVPSLGEPRVTRYMASLLAKDHFFDTGRARRDFGFEPEITPREGVEELVAHYRSALRAKGGAS